MGNYVLPGLLAGAPCWTGAAARRKCRAGERKGREGLPWGKVPHSLDKQRVGSVITVKTLQEGGSSGTALLLLLLLLLLLPQFHSVCCSHGAADQAFAPHASPCYSDMAAYLSQGTQAKNLDS